MWVWGGEKREIRLNRAEREVFAQEGTWSYLGVTGLIRGSISLITGVEGSPGLRQGEGSPRHYLLECVSQNCLGKAGEHFLAVNLQSPRGDRKGNILGVPSHHVSGVAELFVLAIAHRFAGQQVLLQRRDTPPPHTQLRANSPNLLSPAVAEEQDFRP